MTTLGNYTIIRQIGEGGFGRTYEAEHLLLQEKACLKQNTNLTTADAELLRQEAKLLWTLHHHSLPAMKDFFQAKDGSYILAMSFIEGKNLEQIIKKHHRIHPEDVCWISQRLLQALHYIHYHGIVHADVKPQNVIVQPEKHNAVLVDYGLASLMPTRKTSPTGYTEAFAAPELLALKPPVPESDLYGLGLTMIYALGGDPFAKTLPTDTQAPLADYINALIRFDPATRPTWEKADLVKELSDLRLALFGRRHMSNSTH